MEARSRLLWVLAVWSLLAVACPVPTGAASYSTTVDVNALTNTYANPVTLQLDAGDYTVTPVQGTYTAWSPWGNSSYECNYDISAPGGQYIYTVGRLDTTYPPYLFVGDYTVYGSATDALNHGSSVTFTLATAGTVSFFIADEANGYYNNTGGMSLQVSSATYTSYNLEFHYGDGDYYTGTVIAVTGYNGYKDGYTEVSLDEKGQAGYYKITGAEVLSSDASSMKGLVYVMSYYHKKADGTYTMYPPMNLGNSQGSDYLGSEYDYIIKSGVTDYYFGGGYYEAALVSYAYTFKFSYGDGSYYTGTVYAAPEYGYSTTYTKTTTDQNAGTGLYEITGVSATPSDVSKAGEVYVSDYYLKKEDDGSYTHYTPVSSGTAVGTNYLTSETDYIIKSGVPSYLFGEGYYEAELVTYRYFFEFKYEDGSAYFGYVYAEPEYGYGNGYPYTKNTTQQDGGTGTYKIVTEFSNYSPIPTYDISKAGQVYVYWYIIKSSSKSYQPVNFETGIGVKLGSNYLGSEYGYIIADGVPQYYFGGGYYEAKATATAYDFNFDFLGTNPESPESGTDYAPESGYYAASSTDSYSGIVYAAPEYGYYVGDTWSTASGTYTITGETTGYDVSYAGQVYVTSYYDSGTGTTYSLASNNTPAASSYLGGESNYVQNLTPYAYTFTFTYGDGDSYTGTVYAASGYGYYTGLSWSTTDENGRTGTYTITGVTSSAMGEAGQVCVTSYYDAGSGKTYTPVSSGTAVGTNYLTSEHDYIILSGIPEFYFGGGYYEADVGSYSRYDFTFYFNNGSGDCYTGYVYAPTSFETSQGGFLSVGTYLYDQPMQLWASGYQSFNGAAYYITAITDGYASSYDKKSYITAYCDEDTAKATLGVNSDSSASAGSVYVADRTASWESGYAISGWTVDESGNAIYGSQHDTFSVYKEGDVTLSASAPPSPAAPSLVAFANYGSQSPSQLDAAQSQAVWAAYWSQAGSLLEEER